MLAQWLSYNFTRSPVATLLGAGLIAYVTWQLFLWIRAEIRLSRYLSKLPNMGTSTIAGKLILGTMELYFYTLNHLTREKGITQLITGFYQVEEFYRAGLGTISLGPQRVVALFRQDWIEYFITSMDFIEKSVQYEFLSPWLGLGLLTSTGEKWKRNRKLLTPAFHFKILDTFFPVMNDNSEVMMERFEKVVSEKGSVDIRSYIADCTLDTICETAMGTTVGAQDDNSDIDYINPLNHVLKLVMRRVVDPLQHNPHIYKLLPSGKEYHAILEDKIHSFVRKVILDRKESMEQTLKENDLNIETIGGQELETFTKKRYAFLDSLLLTHLKNPKEFTMQDIQDEVNTFMFEGHDTTSMSLVFTLHLVASDPRVQAKVQEELDSLFIDDPKRQITLEDTRQMKYLEMVIKEGLRLYPSVPFFARKLNKDVTIKDRTIPAGVTIMFITYLAHRDKEVFPQPEKFLPERFEPEAKIHKMPYAYIPFSAGPRNCIGQKFAMLEMKIILASILRKYHVKAVTKRDELDVTFSVIIKSETPVEIAFERREMYK